MKKIYLLFLILFTFTTTVVFSQTSHDKISYQSVVRDGNNHLVYDTWVTVTVSIANGDAPSTVVYSETHTVMSNANGLISFLIGGGSNPSGNWDAIQWNRAEITLVTNVNGMVLSTHTYPLSAVPYALYAKNAATSDYADSVDLDVVQHFIETSGYLTDELQVLSISNDTIYLSQGGWVKLPAGFSGDYNDLINKPDLKPVATSGDYNDLVNKPTKSDLCDSVKDCVTGWISDSTQMVFDTLQNYYATKNALRDTASALRDVINTEVTQLQHNIDTVSGNVRGALIDTASDIRDALVDTAAAIRADMGDAAHDAKITIQKNGVTVGDFTLNQTTPDTIDITVPTKVTDLEDADDYVTKAKLNDTLKAYTTTSQIDTLLGDYATIAYVKDTLKAYYDTTLTKKAIHDTANALRGEFPTVNNGKITIAMNRGTVDEATFYVNQDGEQTVMINLPDEALVNNGQLTIITDGDTTRFTANQSGNDTVNLSGFVTTARLNDTLNAYYTKGQVKDTLVNFASKDTLVNFARKDTLVNFARKDTLVNFARKDTLVNFARKDTLVNFARKDTLVNFARKDTLVNFARKDTLVNFARKDTLVNFARKDTLVNFARKDTLVNFARKDTLVHFARKDTLVNFARKDTLANFATKDTLKAYFDTTLTKKAIHDTANVLRGEFPTVNNGQITIAVNRGTVTNPSFTVNQDAGQTVTINIPDEATVNNGQLTIITKGDTTRFTANQSGNDTANLSGFVTTAHLNDTLNAYYTKGQVKDTLMNFARKDTLVNFARKDTLVNFARKDTLVNFARKDTLVNFARKDTLVNFARKDTLVNFARKDTLVNFARKDTLVNFARKDTLVNFARKDTLVNFARKDTLVNFARKDTLVNFARKDTLVNFARKDTLVNFARKDTLVNFARKDTLVNFARKDTLVNFARKDTLVNFARKDTLVNFARKDTLVNFARKDTLVNFARKDTLVNFARKDTLVNFARKDTLVNFARKDTLVNFARKDTLVNFARKDTLVNFARKDTLVNFARKDTLVNFARKDTLVNFARKDTLVNFARKDTLVNFARKDTLVNFARKDTLVNFARKDTLVNFARKDTLVNFARKDTLVNFARKDTLANFARKDTLVNFARKDTLVNFARKDTLVNFARKDTLVNFARKDTLVNFARKDTLVNFARKDTLVNFARKDTLVNFARKDTLVNFARKDTLVNFARKDTLVNFARKDTLTKFALKEEIGDGTLTITKGAGSVTFTANQKTNAEVSIPTKLSEMTNDGGKYAKRDSVNVFTENNAFTDTVTVPNGYVLRGEHATNETNCGNIVVNACDLWAVFDSLTKRMDAMQETIEGLRDSVKTLMPKLSLVANPASGAVCGEKPATITYTANISNGNTADYQFKWTVEGTDSTNVTGPTLTCRFTNAGEYKVVCTATSTGRYTLNDSVTLNVTVGTPPVFSTSSNDLRLTLTSTSLSDIDSIAWGDNYGVKNPTTNPVEHDYSASGTYTITVFSTTGCKEEKDVTVKVGIETDKLTPCNVTAAHTDNTIYTATTGGLETTNENGAVTTVQDQDGHEYYVAQIGSQCWMAENLRSKKYSSSLSGTPELTLTTGGTSGGAYYAYPGNDSGNEGIYGLLYNWQAMMGGATAEKSQGICPDGWHIPSRNEYTLMSGAVSPSYAGMYTGGASGTWNPSDVASAPGNYSYSERNSTGFTALPAGYHENNWPNQEFHIRSLIWSSTERIANDAAYALDFSYDMSSFQPSSMHETSCFSVRCLRDEENGGTSQTDPTVTTDAVTNKGETSVTMNATITNDDNVSITNKGFEYKLTVGGTYSNFEGTITETTNGFTADLTNLTANTSYTYKAFITFNNETVYGSEVTFTTDQAASSFTCGTSKVSDADGNEYNTMLVGTGTDARCWMAENLRTKHYSQTGTPTLKIVDDNANYNTAYYAYPNGQSSNESQYGLLYNFYAVMGGQTSYTNAGSQGICPDEWHVPTNSELDLLLSSPPTQFAGQLIHDGMGYYFSYSGINASCYLWSSSQDNTFSPYYLISNGNASINAVPFEYKFNYYISVRCVRDGESGGGGTSQTDPTVTTDAVTNKGETSVTMNATITNDDNVSITNKGFEYKLTVGGTYSNFEGTITETTNGFTADLTNLTANTSYTYKAFITFNNETVYGSEVTFTTDQAASSFTCGTSKVSDADGIEYHTVQIGTQCWMAENLRSTQYSDGTTEISDKKYPDGFLSNVANYGYLYNWNAVMNGATSSNANPSGVQGICPTGWHVPSMSEFPESSVLFETNAAGAYFNSFSGFDYAAYFWSTEENTFYDPPYAKYSVAWVGEYVFDFANSGSKENYFSVRCVKD